MISSDRECHDPRCNLRTHPNNGYDSASELGGNNRSSLGSPLGSSSRDSPLLGERTGYSREGKHRIGGDRAMLYPRRGSTRGLMDSLLNEGYSGRRGELGGGLGMGGGGGGWLNGGLGGRMSEGLGDGPGGGLGEMNGGLGGRLNGTGGRLGHLDEMGGINDYHMSGGLNGGLRSGGLGSRPNLPHPPFENPYQPQMGDPRMTYMGGNDPHGLRGMQHPGLGNPNLYGPRPQPFGNRSPMLGSRSPMLVQGLGQLHGLRSPASQHSGSVAGSMFDPRRMDRQRMPYGPNALLLQQQQQQHSNYRAPYVEDYESEADLYEEALRHQEMDRQFYEMGRQGPGMYGSGYGGLGGMR